MYIRNPNNQMVVYKQERPQLQGAKVQTYYNDGNNSPGFTLPQLGKSTKSKVNLILS